MVSRVRDSGGKFIKASPYGQKNIGIRLLKEDEAKLLKMAEEKGITPTEMGRIAIAEWLAMREKFATANGE